MIYFRADQTDQLEVLAPHGPKIAFPDLGACRHGARGWATKREAAGELTPRVRGVGGPQKGRQLGN